jgi:hypothetical protein
MELLKPDAKSLLWAAIGFLVIPYAMKLVRR